MNAVIVLTTLCLIGAVVSLARGIFAMSVGGEYDEQMSERMMVARLRWHALAVVLLVIGYFLNF